MKFVVIDHSEALIKSFKIVLIPMGHEVYHSFKYSNLKSLVKKHKPDVILFEVVENDMKRIEFLRNTVEKLDLFEIVLILMSNKALDEKKAKNLIRYTYADGLILKPFRITTLINKIEKLKPFKQ